MMALRRFEQLLYALFKYQVIILNEFLFLVCVLIHEANDDELFRLYGVPLLYDEL
jgi:hypothetical protein